MICDNCGKGVDNNFSNYCNSCREEYHNGITKERERTTKENEKFWDDKKEN